MEPQWQRSAIEAFAIFGTGIGSLFTSLYVYIKMTDKKRVKSIPKKKIKKNSTSKEYSEMLDEIDRTYEGMKKDKLIPEDKDAIYDYFDRAIDLSDEMGNSYATGTVLTELQDMFDPNHLETNQLINKLPWYFQYQQLLYEYKNIKDLKKLIQERLNEAIYSDEQIEDWDEKNKPSIKEIESTAEYWNIGKSDQYKYKDEASFINDVNWDYVISRWSSAWDKACKK